MMWLALVASAFAAPPAAQSDIVDVVLDELNRAKDELSLPDSPSIYMIRGKLLFLEQRSSTASLGGLVSVRRSPAARLGIEVRVGDPSFDNTGFGGWQDGFRVRSLPQQPTPRSSRLDTWRVVDRAYKDAVEQYSRKRAQAVLPADHPGDYQVLPPLQFDGGEAPLESGDKVVDLGVRLSQAFVGLPGLEVGEVHLGHEAGSFWVIDTDGARVRRPVSETTIRAVVHLRTPDGMRVGDQHLWTVRRPSDLPSEAEMIETLRTLGSDVAALAGAEPFVDEYVGPVIFEDAAAADLFRWVLLPQLEGTPAEIPFDTFIGDLASAGGAGRMNRRVLPQGWTVRDDPSAFPEHPGWTTHDWEGTPAVGVDLVRDGIVTDLLMSRVPKKGLDGTNGHGYGSMSGRAIGKASMTTVRAPRALPEGALVRRGLKLSASYGHDYVLVVRRLQDPATVSLGEPDAWSGGSDVFPAPVSVLRVYADGREEVLRGARFAAMERWALRDIVASGKPVMRDYLTSLDGDDGSLGSTGGRPCRMVAPSVLIGELELVPRPPDPSTVPMVPAPSTVMKESSP